jgi:plasmid stabilization system protein ParE
MSSVALESELGDCDVEIYGHEHRAENLEQEESVIEELLEDNELLVFEPLGVQHDTPDIGGTPSWESTEDGYVGGVMDMAEDTMDTAGRGS